MLPSSPNSSRSSLHAMCPPPSTLRYGTGNTVFNKIYVVLALETSPHFDLCNLLQRSCQRLNVTKLINSMFKRAGPSLQMNGLGGGGSSILSG